MKYRLILLFLLIFPLLLAACSSNKDVTFEKKFQCAEHKNARILDLDRIEKEQNDVWEPCPGSSYAFGEIFYSPKEDSCLYTYDITQVAVESRCGGKDMATREFFLQDALTNRLLYSEKWEYLNHIEKESIDDVMIRFRTNVNNYK